MWETIGPYGGRPDGQGAVLGRGLVERRGAGADEYVLGVTPTSPGFATFTVEPHTDDSAPAEGDVPTPHGMIHVAWAQTDRNLVLHVDAPPGTEVVYSWRARRG